jgi:hypothetical protein
MVPAPLRFWRLCEARAWEADLSCMDFRRDPRRARNYLHRIQPRSVPFRDLCGELHVGSLILS